MDTALIFTSAVLPSHLKDAPRLSSVQSQTLTIRLEREKKRERQRWEGRHSVGGGCAAKPIRSADSWELLLVSYSSSVGRPSRRLRMFHLHSQSV
jgi:hypothetical protein